jgi:hypothetical protein
MRRPRPPRGCRAIGKKEKKLNSDIKSGNYVTRCSNHFQLTEYFDGLLSLKSETFEIKINFIIRFDGVLSEPVT